MQIIFDNVIGISVGVDSGEIFECHQADNSSYEIWMIGWMTDNYTRFDNNIDHTTTTTGSYVDTDLSSDIPANNNGAHLSLRPGNVASHLGALRKQGLTGFDEYHDLQRHLLDFVEVDGDRHIDQKIENTNLKLFLMGYMSEPAVPSTFPIAAMLGL